MTIYNYMNEVIEITLPIMGSTIPRPPAPPGVFPLTCHQVLLLLLPLHLLPLQLHLPQGNDPQQQRIGV